VISGDVEINSAQPTAPNVGRIAACRQTGERKWSPH
jgi:hypothetical protein